MKQNYKLNRNMKLIQLLIVYFIVLKCLVTADVIVINGNQTIEEFRDLPAQFGKQLPSNGLTFSAVEAYPSNGCEKISPPPKKEKDSRWVVLIARGNCTFVEKVRRAQDAGFDAVIIFNVGSDALERMGADNAVDIKIPSVFIGETSAKFIQEGYLYPNEYLLLIIEESQFNINTHLILPFSILVGLCFIIMIAYMLIKCAREQRRLRRHRLPKRLLRKLGTTKFCKTDPYDTCVICLDEYSEGEKIRVLPCGHAYHCQCIDPWLTKNRRVCPICKRKVFPGRQSRPNSVRRNSIDSTTDSETDDTAPLLNPVENSNNHGTFSNNEQSLNQISVNNTAADTENIRPSSDEENALDIANRNVDGNQQSSQRINPFNRVPPNLVNDENNRRSFWSRLFRRQTSPDTITTISRTIEPSQQHEQQDLSVSIPVNLPSSSNNILNSNLSGSLKDSDEELLERNSIYESTQSSPTINIIPSSAILTNPYDNSHNNDNLVFVQTPPSQGGLGVVALPNTNFTSNRASSSTIPTERRTRPNSNRHFIV